MSGVKLTVLLPLLNHLLRHVVGSVHSDKASMHYLLVLCNSTHRCKEMEQLVFSLTQFCREIVDVLGLYSNDSQDNLITLKRSTNRQDESLKSLFKSKCKVIITTPS